MIEINRHALEDDHEAEIATLRAEIEGLRYDAETARLIEERRLLVDYPDYSVVVPLSGRKADTKTPLGEAVRAAVKGEE